MSPVQQARYERLLELDRQVIRLCRRSTRLERLVSLLNVVIICLATLLFLLVLLPPARADSVGSVTDYPSAWHCERERRFNWYCEEEARRKTPSPELAPRAAQKPQPTPREAPRKELADFEAMQKQLDTLKKVAIMTGKPDDIRAYLEHQQLVVVKSSYFADAAQRVVWASPSLDHSLKGRPTNNFAMQVFDEELARKQRTAVQALAQTHGLFFFFRSDCPYCKKFAPVLKRFEEEFGLKILPISMDGGGLPEFPHFAVDNGASMNLRVPVVPALFLAIPGRREITPIGYGLMSQIDLVDRLFTVTQVAVGAR